MGPSPVPERVGHVVRADERERALKEGPYLRVAPSIAQSGEAVLLVYCSLHALPFAALRQRPTTYERDRVNPSHSLACAASRQCSMACAQYIPHSSTE